MARDAIVTFTVNRNSADDGTDLEPIPERQIVLNRENNRTLLIGRGSKSGGSDLDPAPENGLFSSRVMSREHALLTADWDDEKILLEDTGSMHGTYINSIRLTPREARQLRNKDVVRFGTEISRGRDFFSPLDATVTCQWVASSANEPLSSQPRPLARNNFSLEYVSDDEYDEEDEVQVIGEMARGFEVHEQSFSPAPSDFSSVAGVPSSYVSEDDADYEINTSPSSPAGLTDEEKAADLASVQAVKSAPNPNLDAQPIEYSKMATTPIDDFDYTTESEQDTDEEELYAGPTQLDKAAAKESQGVRQPSPSDAAMPRTAYSSNAFPPEIPRQGYQQWLCPPPQLPGIRSFESTWNESLNRMRVGQIQQFPLPAIFEPAPLQAPRPFSNFSRPSASARMDYEPHRWEGEYPGVPQSQHENVEDVFEPQSSAAESSKSLKRNADCISTEDDEHENETSGADVEEITAYAFHHRAGDKTTVHAEAVAPQETVEKTQESEIVIDIPAPAPVVVFHGDREVAAAPPRKRVRIAKDIAARPKNEAGFGRLLATALAGVAVGAVGAVWGLVSLPENFFA